MKFLKLHVVSGQEVRINMDFIESYGKITPETFECEPEFNGLTFLGYAGISENDSPYIVTESPEEIDEMLK